VSDLERGFTLTRTLNAPREAVFRAWTEPERLKWFFSPVSEVREPIEVDLRVGGAWRQRIVVDADTEYVTGGVYREIVPPERVVFTWGAIDGWPRIDPDHPEDGPVVTVTLHQVGETTEMVFRLDLPGDLSEEQVREWLARGIRAGWIRTLDRLVRAFTSAGESQG
jgi:uncharacterized protein YndB with AHSA1/START domain